MKRGSGRYLHGCAGWLPAWLGGGVGGVGECVAVGVRYRGRVDER